jgi:ketosteroid isomerase-like protein
MEAGEPGRTNVEALRGLYREWAKGNLWALRDIAAPEIEWEWSPGLASLSGGPRVYRGLDEIAAATLEWLESWGAYWMTAEEFVEVGDEVVVPMQAHARAAETDSVIEQPLVAVWSMRDGRAVRVRYYEDRDEAFGAAGGD